MRKEKDGRKPILWNNQSALIGLILFSVIGFICSWFVDNYILKFKLLGSFIVIGVIISILCGLNDKNDYS